MLDVEKFARVLYNLAGNAADAMPDGGTLTIRTRTGDMLLAVEVDGHRDRHPRGDPAPPL